MGVYTYNGFWIAPNLKTEPAGTAAGNVAVVVPPGKWTSAQAQWTGSYTGNFVSGAQSTTLGSGGHGNDFALIPDTPKTFDTGLVNASAAFANVSANLGKQAVFNFNFPVNSTWGNVTYNGLTIYMTGTPFGSALPPGPLVRLLPTILGNLYFEESPGYPLDQEPEADAPVFDDPTLGPGSFESIWTPDGYVVVPKPGAFATDRVRGRKRVACLRLKGGVYVNIGPSNLPAIMQVSLPGDAQWLKFTPGLANLGASAGNGNIGVRIYKGTGRFATGVWTTGYTALAQAPDWVGNGSFADLFPWESALTFMVELTGIAATIPASSLFEFRFDGFDLS